MNFGAGFSTCELPYQILYYISVSYPFLLSHMELRIPKIKSFGGRAISHTRVSPYVAASWLLYYQFFFFSRKHEFFFLGKPGKSRLLWSQRSLIVFLDVLLFPMSQTVCVLCDTES